MSGADNGFWLELDETALKALNQRLSLAANALEAESRPGSAAPARPHAAAPARAQAKETPKATNGFLAELALEVEHLKSHLPAVDRNEGPINDALTGIFSFLNRMSDYANELSPKISRTYRLDTKTLYVGLHWQDAHASLRKQSLSEKAPISHVSFRASLIAARTVSVVRRWDMMDALRNDLSILGLRIVEDQVFQARSEQEFQTIELEADIPVQLFFQADYDKQQIDVVSRNLEGFGISAFVLDPAGAGEAFLDKLGRFLMARSNKLPEELTRVNYKKQA